MRKLKSHPQQCTFNWYNQQGHDESNFTFNWEDQEGLRAQDLGFRVADDEDEEEDEDEDEDDDDDDDV